MRRLAFVTVLLVVVLVTAPGAGAQTAGPIIERAAQALKTDNVYVDPAAERKISDSEADDLRQQIRESTVPLFIAVLPAAAVEEVGGDPNQVPAALRTQTGLAGTYAALAGDSFRAAGPAASIATAAFQARRSEGQAAVLQEFVRRTAAAQSGGEGGAAVPTADSGSESTDSGGSNVGLLALLGLGGAGIFFWSRSRNRKLRAEAARAEAADRQMLQAELSVLADDVMRLEPEVDINPDARADYDAAVNRYRAAAAALEYADEPVDLIRVERVIAEARYAMDRARARIDGREPPPPPAELQQPGRHNEPPLEVDERGEPAYAGGGGFYGGGWFGGGGGLFTGLLLGQMLGGFGSWGGGHYEEHNYYGDGGGDGGDGGGWGGGDFGGGDFGGGDFGGGDF